MDPEALPQLLFWAAVLGGLALGAIVAKLTTFMAGVAVGCLCIGAGGFAAAWQFAQAELDRAAQSESVEGVIVEAGGKPLVRYVVDGETYEVSGLEGSQSNAEAGDKVRVSYLRAAPAKAVIGDFQNAWGPTLAFGVFGTLPTLFGLVFAGTAYGDSRARRGLPPVPSPRLLGRLGLPMGLQRAVAALLIVAGNVAFIGAFVVIFAEPFDLGVEDSTSFGFLGVGGACAIFILQQLVSPRGRWGTIGTLLVVGAGFAIFGGGFWALNHL
jgi:hypothetical protein